MISKLASINSGVASISAITISVIIVGTNSVKSGRTTVQPLTGSNANGNDLIAEVRALRAEFSQLNKKSVTIQSNMDGKTVASQTASFSDLINGLNMQFAERGVAR